MRHVWLALSLALAFGEPPPFQEAKDLGGLDARSAALILSGEQGGELDISVLPVSLGEGTDGVEVVLVIDIEDMVTEDMVSEDMVSEDMVGVENADPPITEVYAYALGEDQSVGGFLAQGFRVNPARRGVKFFGRLKLTPGAYSLRVLVLRRSQERLGLVNLPLVVPATTPALSSGDDNPEDWVLVGQALRIDGRVVVPATRTTVPTANDTVTVMDPPDHEARRGRLRRRQLASGYADVLGLLASSDLKAAREALVLFEQAAFDEGLQDALAPTLLDWASRLASYESDSLVPLIHLHEKVYRDHHRDRRYLFATHSKRMLVGLGKIYGEHSDSEASRALIANAFASLGGYLQKLGSTPAAEVAYKDSLTYQPDAEAALLGLASIYEVYGEHARAADLLKRLVERYPDNAEARLRHAVCLHRLGQAGAAAKLYRTGLKAERDWLRVVAYQELAGLLVSEKRYPEAVVLLEEALELHPSNQRFYLQLAAVHDHLQRPAEADEILKRLNPVLGRDVDSPRLTYSRWPRGTLEAARRTLTEAAEANLAGLASALARVGAED